MTPETIIYTVSFLIAATAFAYFYWKDATEEGYSPNKIFDSHALMILGGFIGGKIAFRPLSIDYFRYQFLTSPLILEGVLLGGGIAMALFIRANKWDGWKIGDLLSAALSIFTAIIFTGFAVTIHIIDYAVLAVAFYILFGVLRYLRVRKRYGTSRMYFELKRYDKVFETGILFLLYLTTSSVIAILFLAKNFNFSSNFWKLQIGFYLLILLVSSVAFVRKLRKSKKAQNEQQLYRKN